MQKSGRILRRSVTRRSICGNWSMMCWIWQPLTMEKWRSVMWRFHSMRSCRRSLVFFIPSAGWKGSIFISGLTMWHMNIWSEMQSVSSRCLWICSQIRLSLPRRAEPLRCACLSWMWMTAGRFYILQCVIPDVGFRIKLWKKSGNRLSRNSMKTENITVAAVWDFQSQRALSNRCTERSMWHPNIMWVQNSSWTFHLKLEKVLCGRNVSSDH